MQGAPQPLQKRKRRRTSQATQNVLRGAVAYLIFLTTQHVKLPLEGFSLSHSLGHPNLARLLSKQLGKSV